MNAYYYAGLVAASCTAVYHYFLIKNRDRKNCFKAFLGNNWFGLFVFGGVTLNYLTQ
jgi:4-hydroxybenzoate polyprenyltransferase